MLHIRDRIQINGEPISEQLFRDRFFEVWDALPKEPTSSIDIPRYLQFLALLSFHIFIKEEVDVAIYECHLGGKYDATNVVSAPVVTATTSIAMDHVQLLGPSIEDIANHKAGIFKEGIQAFSVSQRPEVALVLKEIAARKHTTLTFIGVDRTLPAGANAIGPETQKVNCSLAVATVNEWLDKKTSAPHLTREEISQGLESFSWPGRYQQVRKGHCQWFLDGAHNVASLEYAIEWFAITASENAKYAVSWHCICKNVTR